MNRNKAVQKNALKQGLSEELKDSLQHCTKPGDLTEFVKLCLKQGSQIWVHTAECRLERWSSPSSKKPHTAANPTLTPETTPAGTVAGYYGPPLIDLSAVKGKRITPEKFKQRREGGLYKYCGDSRHFEASCPRRLKAASG
jgi:hypothetical protein